MRRAWLRWVVGGLAACGALAAGAQPGEAVDFTLANGLRVALRPHAQSEQVCVLVRYRAGEAYDPAGASGTAHLAEHVYVTGAAGDAPARDVQAYVARYPLGWNAQTFWDGMVFAVVVEPDAARVDAELIDAAARMARVAVTDADVAREAPRVVEELANMYERVPTMAAANRAVMRARPYPRGGRRGGVAAEVEAVTTDALRVWMAAHLVPANATLVVAGGFDAEAVEAAVRERFGALPGGEPVARAGWRETGEAGAVERMPAPAGSPAVVAVARATPDLSDPVVAAAWYTVVARLWVRGGPAGAFAQYAPLEMPDVLVLQTSVNAGESAEAARGRLDALWRSCVADALVAGETFRARSMLGVMLGVSPTGDLGLHRNVYLLAWREAVVGSDAGRRAALIEAWAGLDDTGFQAATAAWREQPGWAVVTSHVAELFEPQP